jgi:hypothetical protein
VAEAVAQGLVKGYPDGTFRPEKAVSPLELKVMIARLLRLGSPPPDQVDAALRSAGIDPTLPDLGASRPLCMGQALVLLDRAMSTPIYARFPTLGTQTRAAGKSSASASLGGTFIMQFVTIVPPGPCPCAAFAGGWGLKLRQPA